MAAERGHRQMQRIARAQGRIFHLAEPGRQVEGFVGNWHRDQLIGLHRAPMCDLVGLQKDIQTPENPLG
jgi:hypothetical protein